MEIKKSYQADLEHKRTTSFLLGLILVFAVLYVGLEYHSTPSTFDMDADLMDDLQQDMEMLPPVEDKDMVSAQSPAAAPKDVTTKVKHVEHTTEDLSKIDQNSDKKDLGEGTGANAQQNVTEALPQNAPQDPDNPLNFRVVEELPQFPGGWVEFMKFLNKNIKYPAMAQQRKIQGKVVVSFIVNKDGSVSAIKVTKSADPLLDKEAIRVLNMMPKWTAGKDKGKTCRTMIAIPINFQL